MYTFINALAPLQSAGAHLWRLQGFGQNHDACQSASHQARQGFGAAAASAQVSAVSGARSGCGGCASQDQAGHRQIRAGAWHAWLCFKCLSKSHGPPACEASALMWRVQIFAEAQTLLPGGVNSPVRAFKSVGGQPIIFDHVSGPYCFDVDGNKARTPACMHASPACPSRCCSAR